MANRWGTPVGQLRALFVLATLFGGLGALAYGACWLVLPSDRDEETPSLLRGVASVSLFVAALAGLGTLAVAAATATLFSFGWAVAVVTATFLVVALVMLPVSRPAWILLPLLAMVLPAVVVAASGVRVLPEAGLQTKRPQSAAAIPAGGYRAGLGDLFVDLRDLRLVRTSVIQLKVTSGLGDTIVALPKSPPFNIEVDYATATTGWGTARLLIGSIPVRSYRRDPLVVLFGKPQRSRSGRSNWRSPDQNAPTLRVTFTSLGGSLWLGEYPFAVAPLSQPDTYGHKAPAHG
jgi:hypothetical protein